MVSRSLWKEIPEFMKELKLVSFDPPFLPVFYEQLFFLKKKQLGGGGKMPGLCGKITYFRKVKNMVSN